MRRFWKGLDNMKRASTLTEAVNVFDMRPLSDHDQIEEFYVSTAKARGEDSVAKIMYLLKHSDKKNQKFLLMGHNGCGKSTELYKIADKMKDDYLVIHYSIGHYVDYKDLSDVDVLFSILTNILEVSTKNNLQINEATVKSIYNYWHDEKIVEFAQENKGDGKIEGQSSISFFKWFSAKIQTYLQTSASYKKGIRRRIEPSLPDLINKMNNFIDDFSSKVRESKQVPLLMIDDLDKIGLPQARDIFIEHINSLTSLNIDSIYTFPIYLYYSPDFNYIDCEFDECVLWSMIKVKTEGGRNYEEGIDKIREIIEKRADSSLFEDGVLEFAIEKSGGCIRTVFRLLREAALHSAVDSDFSLNVQGEEKLTISQEDIKFAYSSYKSEMERVIRKDQLDLLREIYKTKHPITDKDNVLVMDLLRSLAVIEYNSKRWCDLNPAIKDFLQERNELES